MILWRVLLGPVDHSKGMNVIWSRFYGAQPSIRSKKRFLESILLGISIWNI